MVLFLSSFHNVHTIVYKRIELALSIYNFSFGYESANSIILLKLYVHCGMRLEIKPHFMFDVNHNLIFLYWTYVLDQDFFGTQHILVLQRALYWVDALSLQSKNCFCYTLDNEIKVDILVCNPVMMWVGLWLLVATRAKEFWLWT